MVSRRTEKLTKRFIGLYKVKKITLANVVEFELSSIIKIYPVVNISRIHRYIEQVEKQKKEQLALVIIKEEEQEIKKILNKQQIKGKDKYLVWQKGFTVELNTWEEIENMGNTKKVVEEFEKKYQQDIEDV